MHKISKHMFFKTHTHTHAHTHTHTHCFQKLLPSTYCVNFLFRLMLNVMFGKKVGFLEKETAIFETDADKSNCFIFETDAD